MNSENSENSENSDFNLAWNWFALHSTQRLQLLNFWLVSVAFLVAGYVQAEVNRLAALAFGIALLGLLSSLAFWQLDERTRRLVEIAELELQKHEQRSGSQLELVGTAARARKLRIQSYRIIIQSLQLSVAVLFAAGAIYSVSHS